MASIEFPLFNQTDWPSHMVHTFLDLKTAAICVAYDL